VDRVPTPAIVIPKVAPFTVVGTVGVVQVASVHSEEAANAGLWVQ
jgi:hypothetical protein